MSTPNQPDDPDTPEATWHEPPIRQSYPPPSSPTPSYPPPGQQGAVAQPNTAPRPSGYGQPGAQPLAGQPGGQHFATTGPTERNWAVGAHLSGFIAAWVALGFLGPLTVLLVAGNTSPFVRRHAVEALNFNLSVLIYIAVSIVLMFVLVGFVLLPIVGLTYLIASIRGAMAASRGEEFRYPVTIRFIH